MKLAVNACLFIIIASTYCLWLFYFVVYLQNESINRHFKNVSFLCSDVTSPDLKIEPESVDLIFSNWLLMYLSDGEVNYFWLLVAALWNLMNLLLHLVSQSLSLIIFKCSNDKIFNIVSVSLLLSFKINCFRRWKNKKMPWHNSMVVPLWPGVHGF